MDFKKIKLLLIIGAACLIVRAVFFVYSLRFEADKELFTRPAISKVQAMQSATKFLSSLGYKIQDYSFWQTTGYFSENKTALYLLKNFGPVKTKELIKEAGIPYSYWQFKWQKLKDEFVVVGIDSQSGKVIKFEHNYLTSENKPNIEYLAAESKARNFLAFCGVDLSLYSLSYTDSPQGYNFIWSKETSQARLPWAANLTIKEGEVSQYSTGLILPDKFISEYESDHRLSERLANVFSVLPVIIFLISVTLFIVKRKFLDWRGVKLYTGIFALVYGAYMFNDSAQVLSSNIALIIYKLAATVLFALGIFILMPVTNRIFTEAFGTDIFRIKDKSGIMPLFAIGYAYVFIYLFLAFITYSLLEWLKLFWNAGTGGIVDTIFNSKYIYLCPFLLGIIASVMEEYIRAFSMALFKKLFKNTFVSIMLAALLWALMHVSTSGSSYPGYVSIIEKFLIGIVMGYVLLFFGIETAIFAHFLNNFLGVNMFLLRLDQPLALYGAVLCSIVIIHFCAVLVSYFKKLPQEI